MIDTSGAHGAVEHVEVQRKTDYLFRVSMKALIINDDGDILVVKESGRDWWDLPGGGMDHGESIKDAIRRELYEEVSLAGDFEHDIILVEDPVFIAGANMWQIRVTFLVKPQDPTFSPGEDGDEVQFMNPAIFKDSDIATDRKIYEYWQVGSKLAYSSLSARLDS